jgi:branched-chain amino acid transport system substrate-binding protein
MSPKNDTAVLALSLLITLGVGGGILWLLKDQIFPPQTQPSPTISAIPNQSIADQVSFGEKILTPGDTSPAKKQGVQAIASKNYTQAIASLTTALKTKPNDPEALIFLNNARIGSAKSYTIAASVPLSGDPNTALEILRGIAQAQNEINASGGIQGVRLQVAIADDKNNPETAKKIATTLVKNQEVLGVVGFATSDVTLAAGNIYNSGKLVAITPTSTSVKITNFSPYVLRTVPSDFLAARTLANYMVKTLQKKNAAVFFNSQSNYSQSLKSEFVASVSLEGGQVSGEFDLSRTDFSAASSIKQATAQGAEVLMLAANTDTLDKALQVVQVNQKNLPLLGGDDVYTLKTLEIGTEQAVGMILAVPWHINSDSQSDFPKTSRQLWGANVNWRTALAYDATRALIAALARNPTRTGIQQTLVSPDFSTTGASGTIRFLPSGDRNAPVQLVKIVPGSSSGTGYDFVPLAVSTVKINN